MNFPNILIFILDVYHNCPNSTCKEQWEVKRYDPCNPDSETEPVKPAKTEAPITSPTNPVG
jgi:hypothetical protein